MSRRASYTYSVGDAAARAAAQALRRAEAERRHEEWARRTSQVTMEHLARYQSILDDIQQQGLAEFVRSEFDEISIMLQRALALASTDPAAARDASRQIGPRIGPLPRTARQLRSKDRAAAVQARPQRAREAAASPTPAPTADTPAPQGPAAPVEHPAEIAWREALAGWTDFFARDLAYGDLAAVRRQISAGGLRSASEVHAALGALIAKWGAEADRQRREEAELANLHEQLADEPPVADNLAPVGRDAPDARAPEDPEEARREAVQAVMGALEDAGFQVADPRLIDGEVVVIGTRPTGASATFNLTLDGALEYDFSGYRGSSCEADIDSVVPALQDVYGIRLSDEVVSWRNPDDEDATARPRPGRARNT